MAPLFCCLLRGDDILTVGREPLALDPPHRGSVEIDVRPGYDASTLAELIQLVMRIC